MTTDTHPEIILEKVIDPQTGKHLLNGTVHVTHCHHYASLYTQLAEDTRHIADGPTILRESMADTYRPVFDSYFRDHSIEKIEDRISIVEQLFKSCGLGEMKISSATKDGGSVELMHSYVDEGWIKKFGIGIKPINHMMSGFIAAAFCSIFGYPSRSFLIEERESIASGAKQSRFSVRKV